MAFAPVEQNPDVHPTPIAMASGAWASFGGALGFLIDILPVVEPYLTPTWKAAIPAILTVLGFMVNRFFRTSYSPIPVPKPPPPQDIQKMIDDAVANALAKAGSTKDADAPKPAS